MESEETACLNMLRRIATDEHLPLRGSVCDDCAVTCGFYKVYSDALKMASNDEQIKISRQWFCHNNKSKACKGNAENLGIEW